VRTLRGPTDVPVLDLGLDVSRYLMRPPGRDPEHVALDRAEIRTSSMSELGGARE